MTLKSAIALCGSLLSIVILISSQYQPVLGQDDGSPTFIHSETVISIEEPSAGEEAIVDRDVDTCPCILRSECPRIYGSNPLDFSEIGHVEPCLGEGFVRCCGVSVSIVQQSDESPPATDDVAEETTWESESGHEQLEPSSDQNPSNENDGKDDLHESQGQVEDHDEELNEQEGTLLNVHEDGDDNAEGKGDENNDGEIKSSEDDEELEDHIPAESKEDAQTVMVDPRGFSPRKRLLRKFHRLGRPAADSDDDFQQPSLSTETGNEDGLGEGGNQLHSYNSPSPGDNSGSVVYSQRVSDFPAYRSRNKNPPIADSDSNGLHTFNKDSANLDNGESSPSNVENRPRYPIRRRRPINQMRIRAQTHQQQDDVEEQAENNGLSGASSSSSSAPNSPHAPVHVSIQTAVEETQDELGNERRPMSRLVKPRVSALNRRRKRPGSPGTSGEQSESLHSDNSDGAAPTSDNGSDKEKLPHDLKQQELIAEMETDNDSSATIGSTDGGSEPLTSSQKLYQNSPTGKLAPLRPKIRSFSRTSPNPMMKADGETASISSDSTNYDINQNEGQQEVDPDTDAKPVQRTQTMPNGVTIRKVPIRRVKPSIPETNTDSQNEMNAEEISEVPTSPVKGRPIMMRRPINSASLLKNNKQASLADHERHLEESQSPAEPQEQTGIKIEKLDVRERFRGRHRNNPLKASTSATSMETASNEESSQDHHDTVDNLSSSLDTTSSGEPARPMLLRKRVRPLRLRPSALGQGQAKLSDGESEGKLAENGGVDNGKVIASDANPVELNEESERKQTAEIPRVKIRIGGIHPRFPSQRRGQQQQQQETPSEPSPPITSSQEENSDADNTEPSSALRQRHRLTSNRGKLRRPQSPEIISATSESGTSDMSATSETPVTVTSSYSRLRVNSKTGFPLRPVFRRVNSIKPSEENEQAPVIPEESTTIKDAQANQENAFGTRTRFAVQSRFPATKPTTQTEAPTQSEPSDKIGEKQGQLNQLNESPEDNSSHVHEKRVGFGKRKRVRVRVRPQFNDAQELQEEKVQTNNSEHHEEQQKQQGEEGSQQRLVPNQEKKHGAYEEAGRNPETQNSEHVGPEDNVTLHSPGISVALNSNQEPEEQSPSSGNHSTDQVKIVPVGEIPSETEHTAVGNHHEGQEGNDDSQHHYDDDGHRDTENYHLQHHPTAAELDSDAYDLILNQDVRKTLGTQGTHSTHYSPLPEAYKVGGEEDDGDDDGSLPYHSTSPSYHHLNQEHNQHPGEDTYYDQYNHYSIEDHQRETTHSENGHKYSSHDSSKPSYASNGIQRETDDMGNIETLELGTPEYDDAHQMNYNDWHSYEDDLDEDEEESRVEEKFLIDNKSRQNKSSLATKGRVRFNKHSLRVQKGSRESNNEGKPVDISYNKKGEEVGPSTSQSPVNPLSGASYTSESESSTTATYARPSSKDVSEDVKRERNKRIRQKLRRPPTAYINNSEGSTFNNQESSGGAGGGATSAPFTPSIPSPRPTYSGHAALLESVNQSVLSLPKSESLSNYPDSKPLEQFIQNKQLAPERRNRTRVRVKLVTLPTTTPAPTYVANNDHYDDNNGNEKDVAPDASYMEERPRRPSHSGFTFPPFKKSNLELIPSTEAPALVEQPVSVSYHPQQVIFSSTPTTTASPPPTIRRPFKTIMNDYNKASLSPGQASTGPAGSSGGSSVQMTRHNLTSNANKYGTRHRFKVSELKSVPSSPSTVDSPSSTPANEYIETVRKPQIRLRAPEYRRKIPTTPAPIRHYQVSSTSPPPIYSSNENQSPPRQEEVMLTESIPQQPPPVLPIPTNEKYNTRPASLASPSSAYKEEEHGSISIRIASHPNDAIDHDTVIAEKEADQQSQYVPGITRQQENVRENAEPNYISHLPPVAASKNVGKETAATYSSNGGTVFNQKGKYNSRFKVPEKFHQQKPNPSLGSLQGNNLIQPPPPHHIDLEAERELPMKVVETEGNFKTKYAYENNEVSMNVEPVPYPSPPQPQQQIQLQSYDDNRPVNMYQNAVDVDMNLNAHHERKPVLHHVPAKFEEQQPTEPEFTPDIRINVHPVTPMHNEGEHATHNDNLFHAVRERPTPPPQRHPSLPLPPKVLKHSQFGPFPSTDHWSGIPSANSPKLPEFFEQNRQASPPSQSSEMPSEFDTDLRLLTTMEPRPARPPMVRFPEHGHQNVHFNENKENLPLPPPPPVETTLVQFGTDFDGEEEEEEVEHHRRPATFNDNLNLHGSQLHKQPMEFTVLNGNQDSRIPHGPPHPPPAHFPHGSIPTVVIPPQSSVVVPLPAPQLIPAHNVQFMRPHVSHNNMQHQSHAPHFQQNEQPQFHNKPGHPAQQEPSMGLTPHRARPNPMPARPMHHDMKDAEFTKPHFAVPHSDGANKDLHRPQPHLQFSQNHQPNGNNVRANEPQHPKQHHPIMPPQHHQQRPISGETFERPQPIVLKTSNLNSQNAPPPHHPSPMHPDAHVRNVLRQQSAVTFEKPLERPTGNIVFEKEPEKKPINGPPLVNNFPTHPMPNTRDHPLQRPMHPPKAQIKFPESASQGNGGQQGTPPRPGQFGPPPPSQLRLPQYVPFSMGQDRPLRNDSGKQVHDSQARPAPSIHHSQGLQQPGKFGGGQSYPPFPHPQRQNPNGNFGSPPQHFPPHRPQPQVMMPGFPKGPLPNNNNPYFQQRFRNPNARTSRAANLTAEEEKAKTTAESIQRSFQAAEEKATEIDSQSDQQELFIIQNLERSSEEGPSQLLVSDSTESGTPNVEDKSSEKVAAPEYMLNQELIPTSNENSDSSSLRQERELKLEELLEGLEEEEGNKEQLDVLSGEGDLQKPDEISPEVLQPENFVQDLLPDEILESADTQSMLISHPYHPIVSSPVNLESDKEITQRNEMTEDVLKPSKQKNIWGHKGKSNGIEGEKRLTLLKSSDFSTPTSQDKLTLTEIKKSGIMKIKGGKGKSDQQQQQYLAKFKDVSKSEKKQQQKSSEIGNNNEIKEQQEFIAPKVIQRGFHPILPYSEKDPGPIVVPMLPKIEKLLPPGMDLKDGGGSSNNNNGHRLEGQSGMTSPQMLSPNGNPSIVGVFGSNAFRSFQEPNMFVNGPTNQIPAMVQTNHILNTYS